MLNRPGTFVGFVDGGSSPTRSSALGYPANYRIFVLALFCFVPLVVIACRLFYVQTALGDIYAGEFEHTTERHEDIPSRDGRILTAGGEVLAEDIEEFRLKVHYRWLESPPNPAWLRTIALRRLEPGQRRNQDQIRRSEASVIVEQERLWEALAQVTGLSPSQLTQRRQELQTRIEALRTRIEAKRSHQDVESGSDESDTENGVSWEQIVAKVLRALTTPPRREATEPLVLQEELDYHVIAQGLSREIAVQIDGDRDLFPGTRIDIETERVYPQGELAAHVVGYRLPITDAQVQERRRQFPRGDPLDYRSGDRRGVMGLERHYEHTLRGLRGRRTLVFNRRGEVVDEHIDRQPRYGRDLVVGLSVTLQQQAERLLDQALTGPQVDETNGKPLPTPVGGAIVAMDIRTGQILALASGPRFDARTFVEHDAVGWETLQNDQRQPLFHRACGMALPPGSVFKIVSSIGYLSTERLDPDVQMTCLGFLDSPDRYRCFTFKSHGVGHGDVNLVSAIARSCNVYFFDTARRLGPEPLLDWGSRLGLGQKTGIDLPDEAAGTFPQAKLFDHTSRGRRSSGETLQLVIGQGKLTATPIQITRLMALVANGGRPIVPKIALAESVARTDTNGVKSALEVAPERRIDIDPVVLDYVQRGLREVVATPQGTGYKTVRLPQVSIAGKTGTAEPGGGRPDHAWFAGYVPADEPKIAFVVVLEHAGPGGHAAGPLARKLVTAMLDEGLVKGREAKR